MDATLVNAAAATAARYPDREAIRVDDGCVTHGELDDRSRRVAAWLAHQGVDVGSTVVLTLPSSVDLVVAYLGALRAAAMVTLVNPSLGERERREIVEQARPTVVIEAGEALRTDVAPAPDRRMRAEAIAHLAFTSGTTGRPKAAPLTHANVLASVRGVMEAWNWTSNDVLVHALPLQHAHGLTAVHLSLLSGSRSVVLSRFEPETLCAAVERHRASVLFGVPATYARLLDWPGFRQADLSSLRVAISGSAPLPPQHSDALAAVLGQRPLERYGLTEAGFVLSNRDDGERLAGAVGYPLPGIEVQIIGQDGDLVVDGEVGEIVVRGPQVFAGYRGVTRDATFTRDGWFRTGDLGVRSPHTGAVSITGRSKELIISGGMNVYPREVELVLEAHPEVRAAAVVGTPSDRWGEEVVAFVVAGDQALDTGALAEAVAPDLAPFKRPKRYVVVSDLPRNHMGKILRDELRARL